MAVGVFHHYMHYISYSYWLTTCVTLNKVQWWVALWNDVANCSILFAFQQKIVCSHRAMTQRHRAKNRNEIKSSDKNKMNQKFIDNSEKGWGAAKRSMKIFRFPRERRRKKRSRVHCFCLTTFCSKFFIENLSPSCWSMNPPTWNRSMPRWIFKCPSLGQTKARFLTSLDRTSD